MLVFITSAIHTSVVRHILEEGLEVTETKRDQDNNKSCSKNERGRRAIFRSFSVDALSHAAIKGTSRGVVTTLKHNPPFNGNTVRFCFHRAARSLREVRALHGAGRRCPTIYSGLIVRARTFVCATHGGTEGKDR